MIDPKCLKYSYHDSFWYPNQGIGYTATGHLVPCCWFDTPELFTSDYSYMAKPLTADITVEQIVNSDDWKAFYTNLKRGVGLPPCHRKCKKMENNDTN